jgi:Rne/Rng family ribonuclease
MNKELYVSSTPHETKVALVEDDQLAEIYFERENEYTLAGSIYKGRVTRVLPGMQSAFVDIGLERDAFLYVSDFMEFQDDEDGEFSDVAVPRQVMSAPSAEERGTTAPQGGAPVMFEGGAEDESSVEEEAGEPVEVEAASEENGEEADGGARRWRGRRRRGRGRRGRNDEREDQPRQEERSERPQRPAEEVSAPEAASFEPILLPGESISKYQPRSEAAEIAPTPARVEPEAAAPQRRGRREEYQLPADYQPIMLPGESISKYRHSKPEARATRSAVEEAPVESAEVTTEVEEHLVEQPGLAADEPYVAHAGLGLSTANGEEDSEPVETVRQIDPANKKAEKFEQMNVASVFGGALAEQGDDPLVSEDTQEDEEDRIETVAEHVEPRRWNEAPAIEQKAEIEAELPRNLESLEEEHLAIPHEAATEREAYSPVGGPVEHEEIDEEEVELSAPGEELDEYQLHELEEETMERAYAALESGNGEMLTETVEEEEQEDAADEEEFAEGEYEETELVAGGSEESEEGNGRAELRGPANTAGYQQRSPKRRFERGGRGRRQGGRPMRRRPEHHRPMPLISDLLKEGQEVLIQIAKEPLGKKGARITSHIALPGRFLVFMPTVNHVGVSRKINSEEERQRLKRIVSSERENGHGGFIVRTAAAGIAENELRADIRFLKHLWNEIKTRAEQSKAPALIYHDLNLVERVLRDQVTQDFSQIFVDSEQEYERVIRFANRFQPGLLRRIKLYTKDTPLYEQFGIQEEVNRSLKSKVWLKSGGYIVINQTEALVAIDINTGKYVGKTSRLEDTIVKTNIDAIREIVRQIRVRDLGGIIVIDFIDMDERKNRQKVMAALEDALKADRAPSKVLQFNDFGLVAITRKRVKQSLERTLGAPCNYCTGTGLVKSVTTICNEIYVEMRKLSMRLEGSDVTVRVHPDVAKTLKANNAKWLSELEELAKRSVLVKSDPLLHQEQFDIQ